MRCVSVSKEIRWAASSAGSMRGKQHKGPLPVCQLTSYQVRLIKEGRQQSRDTQLMCC
jgi:hypothetical protein